MVRHARALWGAWWWLPALPWLGYAAVARALGAARWDHLAVAALVVATAYGSERSRRFFLSALPLLLVFLAFDGMRFLKTAALAPAGVLGCGLRDTELALFGVRRGARVLTPNELLAGLQSPALDLVCAVPYGGYLFVMVAQWLSLYRRDLLAARRFAWIVLATHLFGFATYLVLPAAPPWYVRAHGCAIDLAATSSPAGLTRVDALLGTTYFRDLYSRGATVYGALPSLHVSYPLYGLLAVRRRSEGGAAWTGAASSRRASVALAPRAIQITYAALMPFAAVYLEHHWVIDVLLGFAYAAITAAIVGRLLRDREDRDAEREAMHAAGDAFRPVADTGDRGAVEEAPRH